MEKKQYVSPTIYVEQLEDDDDYIHIHPDPIDPPTPIGDDDDY